MYRRFLGPYVHRLLSVATPVEFLAKNTSIRSQILHIGAHEGEEASNYANLGFREVAWVEAQPEIFEKLKMTVGARFCLQGAVWSERSILELNISSNSVSTSLLEFGNMTPWKELETLKKVRVETLTLADVVEVFNKRNLLLENFILVLDIQGAEYEALKTIGHISRNIHAISCEISVKPTYENGAKRRKVIRKLLRHGYIPLTSFLDSDTLHGDQLFVKYPNLFLRPKLIFVSLIRMTLLKLIKLKNSKISEEKK
jgi:FkbM family methyltransferase